MGEITVLEELFQVIKERQEIPRSNSYTCYLFEQGLEEILQRFQKESEQVIHAAQEGDSHQLTDRLCDLLYHMLVLMAEKGIEPVEIWKRQRSLGQSQVDLWASFEER